MVKIFSLFLCFLTLNAFAATHTGSIVKIDYGEKNESPLLLLDDGYVLKITSKNTLKDFERARAQGLILKFRLDKNRNVIATRTIGQVPKINYSQEENRIDYTPTVLNTLNEAQTIFKNLRKGARSRSQCYNRAHIWSYESKLSHKLDSMKVFMFYTRKYIREYNFEWWFHVAPYTYVNEGGQPTERVLDLRFAREPLHMKSWTDIFMKNDVVCPEVTKYSQYENHQEAEYCYLFKASMYFVQPLDLDNMERNGTVRNDWNSYEIKRAYRNGFGIW